MADLFQLESGITEPASPSGLFTDGSSNYSTGDLRRKYDFGSRVSELAIAQDPFFRFVSKVSKRPTDDPEFKFTERRPSFHKRYVYVAAHGDGSTVSGAGTATTTDINGSDDAQGDTVSLKVGCDYSNLGNRSNIVGQTTDYIVGGSNTAPQFLVPGLMLKVPVSDSSGGSIKDYMVVRVNAVDDNSADSDYKDIDCTVIRGTTAGYFYMGVPSTMDSTSDTVDGEVDREPYRCYIVGSSHEQGSGYPETWKDQPFSTSEGRTQIWKTSMAMDNTTRATVLKYEPNEWARIWREKLIEHKWDIEQSLLFGTQYKDSSNGQWYTQGAADFVLNYGNLFDLTIASKTQDDFLDDMSNFLDPRYNNANASLFFVSTAVYNWLHKLSGYFSNNLEVSPNFRADMSLTAKKKVFGVDIAVISTPYGDMNVVRNVHLDNSHIKILACNMKYCKYRPLVGNGLNRDTAIYVGVQTLENSGIDRRVDLIQTEAGMEWQMPEAHAIWK